MAPGTGGSHDRSSPTHSTWRQTGTQPVAVDGYSLARIPWTLASVMEMLKPNFCASGACGPTHIRDRGTGFGTANKGIDTSLQQQRGHRLGRSRFRVHLLPGPQPNSYCLHGTKNWKRSRSKQSNPQHLAPNRHTTSSCRWLLLVGKDLQNSSLCQTL